MVWNFIANAVGGNVLGGVGDLLNSGVSAYNAYKGGQLDLLKKTIDIGLDSVNKGVGIGGGLISGYNNWKQGKINAQRNNQYQKKMDAIAVRKAEKQLELMEKGFIKKPET